MKSGKTRLYGYSHRVYKTEDSRLESIKQVLSELDAEIKGNPLVSMAMKIDRMASVDSYFVSRNLATNANLYSGFIHSAM